MCSFKYLLQEGDVSLIEHLCMNGDLKKQHWHCTNECSKYQHTPACTAISFSSHGIQAKQAEVNILS